MSTSWISRSKTPPPLARLSASQALQAGAAQRRRKIAARTGPSCPDFTSVRHGPVDREEAQHLGRHQDAAAAAGGLAAWRRRMPPSSAMGFSTSTCLPARSAAMATARVQVGGQADVHGLEPRDRAPPPASRVSGGRARSPCARPARRCCPGRRSGLRRGAARRHPTPPPVRLAEV